jgi:hypothetical protein
MPAIRHPLTVKHGSEEVRIEDPAKVDELSSALQQKEHFDQFAANPKDFAARYGLHIDDGIASTLKERLSNVSSIKDVDASGDVSCTAVAVAMGAAAAADTKIAAVI